MAILWLLLSAFKYSGKALLLNQTKEAIELDLDRKSL